MKPKGFNALGVNPVDSLAAAAFQLPRHHPERKPDPNWSGDYGECLFDSGWYDDKDAEPYSDKKSV